MQEINVEQLKRIILKLKNERDIYKLKYEHSIKENELQHFDLMNVFDISNELAQSHNIQNLEKMLFYFIFGHFKIKPLVLIENTPEEKLKFKVTNFAGVSKKIIKPFKNIDFIESEYEKINEYNELTFIDKIDFKSKNDILAKLIDETNLVYLLPFVNRKDDKKIFLFGNKLDGSNLIEKDETILKVLFNSANVAYENAMLISELDKNLKLVQTLYDKLQKTYDELKEADKMKTDFLSLISHEFKTPLTGIKAYSDTLKQGMVDTDEERNEFYTIITTEATKMEMMIDAIITIVELESGQYQIDWNILNIKPVLDEIIEELAESIKEKNHNIDIKYLSPENDCILVGDKGLVKRSVKNIIGNAIKYTDFQGEIEINIQAKEENLIISVKDNGCGIKDEDKEKIFTKFGMSESIDYHSEGMGLGLPTAKYIIEKIHKGTISFKSEFEQGSEFIITFNKNKKA